jgi:hypothetical protein
MRFSLEVTFEYKYFEINSYVKFDEHSLISEFSPSRGDGDSQKGVF